MYLASVETCVATALKGEITDPRDLGLTYSKIEAPAKYLVNDTLLVPPAAEAEAKKNNWAVSIAVVDDGGHLVVFQRIDGAKLGVADIAIRKARTAVYFQGETKGLEEEVGKNGRTPLLAIEGFMPLEGGVPLIVGGQLVGGVGVSGVTGQQDAQQLDPVQMSVSLVEVGRAQGGGVHKDFGGDWRRIPVGLGEVLRR